MFLIPSEEVRLIAGTSTTGNFYACNLHGQTFPGFREFKKTKKLFALNEKREVRQKKDIGHVSCIVEFVMLHAAAKKKKRFQKEWKSKSLSHS